MNKTSGGIWYAEDDDPRAYAEQLQAEALSAETAFDEVNSATNAYVNYYSATVIPAVANVSTTDTFFNVFLGGSTITQYGGTFISLSAFNSVLFLVDGWFHVTFGMLFTESVTPATSASRGAGLQHQRNSTFPPVTDFYAERTYTSDVSPQIGTGVTMNQMIGVRAGDTLQTLAQAKASSGTVSGAGRLVINYIGPLVVS